MKKREERFEEIARIECSEICALGGGLKNISLHGLECYFPSPVSINYEKEYSVLLKFARADCVKVFDLVCNPKWEKEGEGKTDIGFEIMRSPDSPEFSSFIENLSEKSKISDSISDMIISSDAEFI